MGEVLAVVILMVTALVGSLLGLLFGPEGYGSTFLRNVGELLSQYTSPHPTT
jgi:hypothetical protein